MRIILLFFTLLYSTAGEPWSGSMVLEAVIRIPSDSSIKSKDMCAYIQNLETFSSGIQSFIQSHAPIQDRSPQNRLLRQDLGVISSESERARLACGGDQIESRMTYMLSRAEWTPPNDHGTWSLMNRAKTSMLVTGGSFPILFDCSSGKATTKSAEGQERLIDLPSFNQKALTALPDPDGQTRFGHRLGRSQFSINDVRVECEVALGLPNPFMIGLLVPADGESLPALLARLPGLPVLVSWSENDRQKILRVVEVKPHPVSDDQLVLPSSNPSSDH